MNHLTSANGSVLMGTIGGTISGTCNVVHVHDLLQTAVASATGAVVSFCVSWLLGLIVRKNKK